MKAEKKLGGVHVSAAQVLRRLAELEAEAEDFYKGLYEGTDSEVVRQFAKKMIRAEKRHGKRFAEYACRAVLDMPPDAASRLRTLAPEIKRLLAMSLLPSRDRIRKSAKYNDDRKIIQFAIRAEESFALLLTELREYVPTVEKRYISRVIKEEWGHKESLERLLAKHF